MFISLNFLVVLFVVEMFLVFKLCVNLLISGWDENEMMFLNDLINFFEVKCDEFVVF